MNVPPAHEPNEKAMGYISYVPLLWVVPLLVARDSKFAMYHANQGAVLTVMAAAVSIVSGIAGFVPIISLLARLVLPGLGLATLAFMVIGMLNVANGHCIPLPYIGQLFTLIRADGRLGAGRAGPTDRQDPTNEGRK